MKNKYLIFTALILCCLNVSAQDGLIYTAELFPNFLITIIAGLLLSFGFQFLLTALSVALGVSAVGNLKEQYAERKYSFEEEDDADENFLDQFNTGEKITAAFGIWNILTIGPSLLLGTYLALKLTPIQDISVNITLAMVIWATFFMMLFYLHSRLAGTLISGLISTTVSAFQSTTEAVKTVIQPSTQSQIKQVADHAIEKIRTELSAGFDNDRIVNTLKKYLDQISNKIPDYESLKKDLQELLEASSADNKLNQSHNPVKWTAIQTAIQTAIAADTSKLSEKSKEKRQQLQSLLEEMKNAYQSGDTTKEGIQNAIVASPLDEERLNKYMLKLQNVFESTSPEDFEVSNLLINLNKIIDDPSTAINGLKERLDEFDRAKILGYLEKNTSLDKSQLEEYASRAELVLDQLKANLNPQKINQYVNEQLHKFENSLARFINSTDDPRLDYPLLKHDLIKAMNNPSESLNIIKRRMATFDRDTLVSIITNTGLISNAEINKVVGAIEEARGEVLTQIKDVEMSVKKSRENLERKAIIQAEATRKTAATAAWWLVATIIIGASSAILGAYLTV